MVELIEKEQKMLGQNYGTFKPQQGGEQDCSRVVKPSQGPPKSRKDPHLHSENAILAFSLTIYYIYSPKCVGTAGTKQRRVRI